MNAIEQQLQYGKRNRISLIITVITIFCLLVWSATAINLENMAANGLDIAKSIILGILNPDWTLLTDFKGGIPYLLIETLAIAFLGTIIGAIIAIPLAFFSASNIVPKPVAWIVRLLLICIRTIPAIVYGLMFVRVTGFGAFTGVLTIAFVSVGMLAKLFVDVIEDLDRSVLESMTSIGCNMFEKIRFGIIPQLSALFLSIVIYRFDMNLRDASILGLVGAGGIGAPLIFAMNSYRWTQVGSILIGLVLLILIVEYLSNKIRTKLVKG
ncbi:phosphonate ABC transporter, permease protein PhnE [Ureibacillus manganicus]|uniref:Phosphonate ABC transporter permease n=1 Tax=Ureibacillus manganicus DSM 26584 TaxID=1384049 RepID=A0A0A3I3Y5_9BACL|nr:phosphonate ABC transporter, permease protein PhnE [Ureibacillus manganicus]KGR79429.1 phosphonate ABC transporter permease [Ureibacillus manganicus DSM 26584]